MELVICDHAAQRIGEMGLTMAEIDAAWENYFTDRKLRSGRRSRPRYACCSADGRIALVWEDCRGRPPTLVTVLWQGYSFDRSQPARMSTWL